MPWIETIPYEQAEGRLKVLYDRIVGPGGNVDNIMMAHSLRPHSMEGHMHLYKYVLHHSANTVPKAFLETIGVLVSVLNGCAYCVEHHFQGLRRLLGDDGRANAIRNAFEGAAADTEFDAKDLSALRYAEALTRDPAGVSHDMIETMRAAGWSDGEILEINQVTAYFSYANRTVLGLGVNTEGDILGLSPGESDDPNNWNHG
ncbi:MAG: peroxidase-related enzyme [Alphaproteobacteria bacterium]|nr:peroxidase-related enzyme [Alphaproteobacteria bacterium]